MRRRNQPRLKGEDSSVLSSKTFGTTSALETGLRDGDSEDAVRTMALGKKDGLHACVTFATAWVSSVARQRLEIVDECFTTIELASGAVQALCRPSDGSCNGVSQLFSFIVGTMRKALLCLEKTPVHILVSVSGCEVHRLSARRRVQTQSSVNRDEVVNGVTCALRSFVCYTDTLVGKHDVAGLQCLAMEGQLRSDTSMGDKDMRMQSEDTILHGELQDLSYDAIAEVAFGDIVVEIGIYLGDDRK